MRRLIGISILLLALQLQAQSMRGTTAAPFLTLSEGSRGIAMGSAQVAAVNDASALFWNPGAAPALAGSEVFFGYTQWLINTKVSFASAVFRQPAVGYWGLAAVVLDYGDMINTTIEQPDGTGLTFTAQDLALSAIFARALTDRFFIGGGLKFINQVIWHENARSLAFDLGTLYRTPFHNLTLGFSITNFGLPMRMSGTDLEHFYDIAPGLYGNNGKIVSELKTDKFNLPLLFRAGVNLDIISTPLVAWSVAADALHPNDNNESLNLGTEVRISRYLFLRAGYQGLFLSDFEGGMSLGGGINFPTGTGRLKIDYAYQQYGRLNDIQAFSLSLDF